MKFDFVIGNPPYQEENDSNGRQPPVYHLFMDAAYSVANKVELITPARFLFDAGNTPSAWNKKMLHDRYFKILRYERDATAIFANTSINGGVAISYRDTSHDFGEIGFFTSFDELNHIMTKVTSCTNSYIDSIVSSRGNYRLTEQFFSDFPNALLLMGTGTGNMVVSNIFDRVPEAFTENPSPNTDCIRFLGRTGSTRVFRYIDSKYIIKNQYIGTYNVLISEADGAAGRLGVPIPARIIGKPEIVGINECGTDTFISIGTFETRQEAYALSLYLQTKFARAMLGIKKVTQHNSKSVWCFVPIQNFTPSSDINWSLPIPQIDQQLYRKYGLTDEEIAFIETHVKEMT